MVGPELDLQRLFKAILENCIHHHDQPSGCITVGTIEQEDRVVIRVEDDGPGIPAEDRVRATHPFTRLDEARGEGSGSVGLGLAIVTDVVRAHGGRLELNESVDLGGLRAEMVLPRENS